MMKTFKTEGVSEQATFCQIDINPANVAYVISWGNRLGRPLSQIVFTGGEIASDIVGTREEVSAAIDEANRERHPGLSWDSPAEQQRRMAARQYDAMYAALNHPQSALGGLGVRMHPRGGMYSMHGYVAYSNPCPTGPSKFKPPTLLSDRPKGWCIYCADADHMNCDASERPAIHDGDGDPMTWNHFCRCGCKKDRGR